MNFDLNQVESNETKQTYPHNNAHTPSLTPNGHSGGYSRLNPLILNFIHPVPIL
jgi:hypothetical protein